MQTDKVLACLVTYFSEKYKHTLQVRLPNDNLTGLNI